MVYFPLKYDKNEFKLQVQPVVIFHLHSVNSATTSQMWEDFFNPVWIMKQKTSGVIQ